MLTAGAAALTSSLARKCALRLLQLRLHQPLVLSVACFQRQQVSAFQIGLLTCVAPLCVAPACVAITLCRGAMCLLLAAVDTQDRVGSWPAAAADMRSNASCSMRPITSSLQQASHGMAGKTYCGQNISGSDVRQWVAPSVWWRCWGQHWAVN